MSNIKNSLNIGSKIKIARKQAGLSQKQLASMLGVSDKAVSAYEVGRAHPPVDTLREISNVTYKPVNYFVDIAEAEEVSVTDRIAKIEHELMEIKKILVSQQLQKVESQRADLQKMDRNNVEKLDLETLKEVE
jgi:transcriptional regulator with XRE-family HTH domain